MTIFEFFVTIIGISVCFVCGVEASSRPARAASIAGIFFLTVFAGSHGFKML